MNGYECCAGALAALLLSSLGRFLVARQGAGPLPMPIDDRHLAALQSGYRVLAFSAIVFLCKDAFVWSGYASEISFGPWQILFGFLSALNLLALTVPFLFHRKL